jgi:hypothetical protein
MHVAYHFRSSLPKEILAWGALSRSIRQSAPITTETSTSFNPSFRGHQPFADILILEGCAFNLIRHSNKQRWQPRKTHWQTRPGLIDHDVYLLV